MYKDILGNFLPFIHDYKAPSDDKFSNFESLSVIEAEAANEAQ